MAKKKKAKRYKFEPDHQAKFKLSKILKASLIFLLVLALIGLGLFLNQPEERKVFGKDALKQIKENQKIFFLVPQANINADYYDVCEIQMQSPGAFDAVRLFFLSPYNQQYDIQFSYELDSGRAGRSNSRLIGLRRHPAWNGMIREILIAPDDQQASLERISFIQANPWTKLKAGWEDFVIYHDPLLGTCFMMGSPLFLGSYFNPFWVPGLWGLLALTFLASLIFRGHRPAGWIAAAFFGVALLVWAVLDLRNNVVYFKNISRNINLYWGRPLEQKRGIVLKSPDFVEFMNFCDREVPLEARMDFRIARDLPGTSNNYLSSTQVEYIFRPRSGKGKLFVLVYGSDFRQDPKLVRLKVYRQFGPQAYILVE